MNFPRALARIAEGALDLLVILAVAVIVPGHHWLDITLWAVALIALVGAIWLASPSSRTG